MAQTNFTSADMRPKAASAVPAVAVAAKKAPKKVEEPVVEAAPAAEEAPAEEPVSE